MGPCSKDVHEEASLSCDNLTLPGNPTKMITFYFIFYLFIFKDDYILNGTFFKETDHNPPLWQ